MLTFSKEEKYNKFVHYFSICSQINILIDHFKIHLPKVRLANPFPVIGKNNTFPAIEYFPRIAKRFVFPKTSNFDVFGFMSNPLMKKEKKTNTNKTKKISLKFHTKVEKKMK